MIKYFSILMLIVGVISYFLGWMYLYYYLDFFGFSIFEVDIPIYYFFIYSFALLDNISIFNARGLIIAAVITILYIILRNLVLHITKHKMNLRYNIKFILKTWRIDTQILLKTWQALALASLFLLGHNHAQSVAYERGVNLSENGQGALIVFNETVVKAIDNKFSNEQVFEADRFLNPQTLDDAVNYISILVFSLPIRLTHSPTTCRVLPFP